MEFSLAQLARDVAELSPEQHGFTYLDLSRRPTGSGRLDGWVLSAKDLNDVAGMPTTLGHTDRAYMAEETDPTLAALEAEGAVIVGKSAAPELGLRVDTEPVGLAHPDNPLWPGATPGGSSGGAAVQVARGLLRAAHASDGGGSIRVPAAACGVVGFKPAGEELSVSGFITRTVADAALLHAITPRTDARLRVGVLTEPLFAGVEVSPVMLRAVDEATDALRTAGFTVTRLKAYPQAEETFEAFTRIFSSRLADLRHADGYAAWIRDLGRRVSARELRQAQAHAARLPGLLADYWRVDVLLTPMLAYDPPARGTFLALPHDENFREQTRWSPWGSLFNVARLPAITVPWPMPGRQPVGLQLGGIVSDAAALLGLAERLHP